MLKLQWIHVYGRYFAYNLILFMHSVRLFFDRPEGIMLQIFIIILFQISSKFVSLCSLLFPKSTDYSHYSQLYCHTFTASLHSNVQKYFVVAYTI